MRNMDAHYFVCTEEMKTSLITVRENQNGKKKIGRVSKLEATQRYGLHCGKCKQPIEADIRSLRS